VSIAVHERTSRSPGIFSDRASSVEIREDDILGANDRKQNNYPTSTIN